MKKILIPFILLILGLSSCTEIINFPLSSDATGNIIVDGGITTDTMAHKIILRLSADYYYNQVAQMAMGAKVTISSANDTFKLHETDPGVYLTDPTVYAKMGQTYVLNIYYNGEHYTASHLIHRIVPIDSLKYVYNKTSGRFAARNVPSFEILYYGQEPSSVGMPYGDYYLWDYSLNGVSQTDTVTKKRFVSDALVDGNYIHDFQIFTFRADLLTSNTGLVTVTMSTISKEYYDFLSAVETLVRNTGGFFSGPPANVPTNILNTNPNGPRAWGFFFANATVKRSIVVKVPGK